MVKVKTFTMGSNHNILKHEILDNQINKFLSENDVEVVDVKYSTCYGVTSRDSLCWIPTALLIYKEK